MKFNKTMTKILSALILVSMVGTSVQLPTYADIETARQVIADSAKETNTAKNAKGSTASADTAAADDEGNNTEGAEAANENAEAASNSGASEGSQGEVNTSSSSAAYNDYSSSSSSETSTDTSQVLEPYSTENDSELLSLDQSFSLFEYFGASKTFTATAAHGDGSDIVWEVGDPKYVSISEPVVDGDKSTVNITWDGETVESIERTPFYAMLASNPFEKVTGTIYLSNGSAPEEGELDTEIEAGSKTEFESEEIKKFVEEMYAEGLTQDNSIYDLSQLDGYVEDETPDYSQMSDEEILALFEEKQAENNADTEKTEETVKENETEENTFDENEKDVNSDNDAKVDAEESENDASKEDIYNKEETQSDLTENDEENTSDETEKAADSEEAEVDADDAEEEITAAEKDEYVTIDKRNSGGGSSDSGFKVTFDAASGGAIADGTGVVYVDSKIQQRSVPSVNVNEGYEFIGWSQDGTTVVDPTTVNIIKSMTFTALYKELTEETPVPEVTPTPEVTDSEPYINGYDEENILYFRPDNTITRAEVAKILAVLDEDFDSSAQYSGTFADVDENAWYSNFVNFAVENGFISGYDDGTCRPENMITRAEFASMIARYSNMSVIDTDDRFSDIADVYWCRQQINTLSAFGIISGYENGTFRPHNPVTRAEVVSMINRMLRRAMTDETAQTLTCPFVDVTPQHWAYKDVLLASCEN